VEKRRMKRTRKAGIPVLMLSIGLLTALLMAAPPTGAQAPSHFLGTITGINGDVLTVKPAQGDVQQVEVPSTAAVKRIAPGQTNLSTAVAMLFSDLAVGDHVLVNLDPNATGATPQALRIVAIKQEDLARKQQQETEAWQHGVGGLVKSVDQARGVIQLASGAGAAARIITVHTTASTVLKRYAPGSVRFEEAQTAPISAIQAGDQLRARGEKNADGTEITADELVSGGFRNISGTVVSLDPANSTLVVKDLTTKKPVTVHISSEAQMRQLPDRMAEMLAARLKGIAAGGNDGARAQGGGAATGGAPMQRGGGSGAADMQQVLSRAPAIQLSDLKKGEAVMLVSTQGASDVTAITLLAGVEALLEAPASQNLLSNWSMNSSAPEEAQ
jgi:hypothetical protein